MKKGHFQTARFGRSLLFPFWSSSSAPRILSREKKNVEKQRPVNETKKNRAIRRQLDLSCQLSARVQFFGFLKKLALVLSNQLIGKPEIFHSLANHPSPCIKMAETQW